MGAVDVALALQIREMLVHSGERAEREARGDFLEARREPVPRDVPGDEIEDLALTASERHAVSRTETEDKFTRKSPERKDAQTRSEEHTSELQSQSNLVCRLLLEKKKKQPTDNYIQP